MIRFACGHCGRAISVDARYAGKKGKCPKCGNAVTVPGKSTVLSFRCGTCGHKIDVPEVHAGKKGRCPKCKNAVVVPTGEEKPVELANAVTCSMCGQVLEPAERSPEPFIECPGCGAYIETSSGAVSSEYDGPPPDEDEDLAEGSSDAAGRPAKPDRRLFVLVTAVAAAVVMAGVVLVAVLRSSGSGPAEMSKAPGDQREVARTELPVQSVVPAVSMQATEPRPPIEATGMTRLRFGPTPGTKRTVRLTTKVTQSTEKDGQQHDLTTTESIDFDLGVMESSADGTVAINVSLAAIRLKSEAAGQALGGYDSAEPQAQGDTLAEIYASFLANRFTVKVSSKSEIVDPGLDGLFLAAAERRLQSEDETLRERLKEKADRAIQRTDERFGSRENRVLALKKQLEEFPVFGREQLAGLLRGLTVALPDSPVGHGDTWEGSLAVGMGSLTPMAGTYTLTAVEQDVCTIQAVGQRSQDEDPVVQEVGQMKVSNKLGGSSEATLRIDRRTGWLLSKEHRTSLHGEITMTAAGPQLQDFSSQVSIEITRTLTTLK